MSPRDPKEMSRTSTECETPMGRQTLPWLLNLAKSSSRLSPAPVCCRRLRIRGDLSNDDHILRPSAAPPQSCVRQVTNSDCALQQIPAYLRVIRTRHRTRRCLRTNWRDVKLPPTHGTENKGLFLLGPSAGLDSGDTRPIQHDADSCATHPQKLSIAPR